MTLPSGKLTLRTNYYVSKLGLGGQVTRVATCAGSLAGAAKLAVYHVIPVLGERACCL
jgi:hypothetical protein